MVRLAAASLAGTAIEFYDFFVYGTAAALVLGPLFFPTFSPVAGTLAAFGTFGVGFVARPLGSVLFGHIGDRRGRRPVLVVSLLLTGRVDGRGRLRTDVRVDRHGRSRTPPGAALPPGARARRGVGRGGPADRGARARRTARPVGEFPADRPRGGLPARQRRDAGAVGVAHGGAVRLVGMAGAVLGGRGARRGRAVAAFVAHREPEFPGDRRPRARAARRSGARPLAAGPADGGRARGRIRGVLRGDDLVPRLRDGTARCQPYRHAGLHHGRGGGQGRFDARGGSPGGPLRPSAAVPRRVVPPLPCGCARWSRCCRPANRC